MSYMRFNYRSEAIGKYIDVSIVLPTDGYTAFGAEDSPKPRFGMLDKGRTCYTPEMKFPTLYLIHGGGDDDSLPFRYTNIERYANENNIMVVTPDVSNSFGADAEYGIDYGLFITWELPTVIQALFPSSPRREDNFIAGFAMGANAALSCGIRAPERYAVCADISGGIGYTLSTETLQEEMNGDFFRSNFPLYVSTFGDGNRIAGSKHDLRMILAKQLSEGKELPKFWIAKGSEEGFIGDRIDRDVEIMREMGVAAEYSVYPGQKHDFAFWDIALKDLLEKILPLKRKA